MNNRQTRLFLFSLLLFWCVQSHAAEIGPFLAQSMPSVNTSDFSTKIVGYLKIFLWIIMPFGFIWGVIDVQEGAGELKRGASSAWMTIGGGLLKAMAVPIMQGVFYAFGQGSAAVTLN